MDLSWIEHEAAIEFTFIQKYPNCSLSSQGRTEKQNHISFTNS
mgnify:CR=1 FL=1